MVRPKLVSLEPGTIVCRHTIGKLLGTGRKARVYATEHDDIVIKVEEFTKFCAIRLEEYFLRTYACEGLPKVYDVAVETIGQCQVASLVMERRSFSLEAVLTENLRLDFKKIARDVLQTLAVLHFHEYPLVFCDVSPANIMYDEKAQRWGLVDIQSANPARVWCEGTSFTPAYACDRVIATQCRGSDGFKPAPQDDLFALACSLLWTIRGGNLPWQQVKLEEIAASRAKVLPQLRGEVPLFDALLQLAESKDVNRELYNSVVASFVDE